MIKSNWKRAFTADDDALNVDSAGRLDQLLNCYDTSSLLSPHCHLHGRRESAGGVVRHIRSGLRMTRARIPNRRQSENIDFHHGGHSYVATISRDRQGALSEVFLDVAHPGSALASMARDAAILASLALQQGVDVETLLQSLTRLDNGDPAGPVGRLLDLVAGHG